ncbi:MFS transporter [Enterobacter roggenkampii]|uniref:MFS transporter n=1 Tax=Enterobacter roggenkampii TaxID=1812935 RepID=UPI002A7FBA35|nr:MFS transporter [Enterobacter roggenkampii]
MPGSRPSESTVIAYWPAVFAIALTMFCLVSAELLPVSLIVPMATSLDVSIGLAGQAVSATALIAAAAGPAVIMAAGRGDRRRLVILLTALITVSALLTVAARTYWELLAARALLGMALGGLWSMVASLSLRLVPAHEVPRAVSVIFTGVTAAGVIAPSIGLQITQIWCWRAPFMAVAATGLLAFLIVFFTLPPLPAEQHTDRASFRAVLTRRKAAGGFVTVLFVLTGHFAGFTYIRPMLENSVRINETQISAALLFFGAAGIAGTIIGGRSAQRHLSGSVAASAMLVALAAGVIALQEPSVPLAFVTVSLWGLAFGAFPVCISAWNATVSHDHAESAGALLAASFQIGIAAGAATGGIVFNRSGVPFLMFTVAGLCSAGSGVIFISGRIRE